MNAGVHDECRCKGSGLAMRKVPYWKKVSRAIISVVSTGQPGSKDSHTWQEAIGIPNKSQNHRD